MAKKTAKNQANTITMQTELFKALVGKAVKGVGNNKLLPLTQLMCIEVKDGTMKLITLDATGTNYLYVKQEKVEGEFYVAVMADQFSKLVGKMTCDKITLEIDDTKLKITGNGEYSIPLQYDEMGNAIQYPDPLTELGEPIEDTQTISSSTIARIINSVKPSLAVTMEVPYLINYYVGDVVTASNGYVLSALKSQTLSSPVLVAPTVFELIALSDATTVSVDRYEEGIMVYHTPDIIVYTHEMEGVDDYPIDAIKQFVNEDMDNKCEIPKNETLQALDRLSLFVGALDDNAIKMNFTSKALILTSVTSTASESIAYTKGDSVGAEFECAINLPSLVQHIKTQSTDVVDLQYGDENAIKILDGDVVQVLDLLDMSAS